jgi:hypothetical protein
MGGMWTLPPPSVGVHRIHGMLGACQQRPRSDRFGDADVGQHHVGLTGLSGQHRIGAYKRLRAAYARRSFDFDPVIALLHQVVDHQQVALDALSRDLRQIVDPFRYV